MRMWIIEAKWDILQGHYASYSSYCAVGYWIWFNLWLFLGGKYGISRDLRPVLESTFSLLHWFHRLNVWRDDCYNRHTHYLFILSQWLWSNKNIMSPRFVISEYNHNVLIINIILRHKKVMGNSILGPNVGKSSWQTWCFKEETVNKTHSCHHHRLGHYWYISISSRAIFSTGIKQLQYLVSDKCSGSQPCTNTLPRPACL